MKPLRLLVIGASLASLVLVGVICGGCGTLRRKAISLYSPEYSVEGKPSGMTPEFSARDGARPRIDIALRQVASGFSELLGVEFVPGDPSLMIALQKAGEARWVSLTDGSSGPWITLEVTTESEQGLLGLAWHPRFLENGKLYLNYTTRQHGKDVSRVEEWTVPAGSDLRKTAPTPARVILEVEQPYQNHNGGDLEFGPDGLLYIGFGDGGYAGDPHRHGQNLGTLLGAMLRVDVDRRSEGKPYGIPGDNPFIGRAGAKPEIFVSGLRNPWRYSFDPRGRLVIADVGQGDWEEITVAARGENAGWNVREGRHCFKPSSGCTTEGLIDPVFEYSHQEGQSVTGGYVYLGKRIPALVGKYIFGDFVSGRLWALDLPEEIVPGAPLSVPAALGKWPVLPAAFARDANGEIYLADFNGGAVYRLDPPSNTR